MKNDVLMIVFETAGRWQDEVGETRGFVAITIDRYHEVETAERGFELTAVRRRQYRVAGARHQCAHLTVAGRQDFLGQCRRRQLATEFRQAAPARFPRAGQAGTGPGSLEQVHRQAPGQAAALAIWIDVSQRDDST